MSADFRTLHEEALARMRARDFGSAAQLFEAALLCAPDEAAEVLVNIYRAGLAVMSRESSPLIDALPRYLMRRDSPLHVLVASYYLVMYHTGARRPGEAARYVKTLLDAAAELDDPYYSAFAHDSVAAVEMLRTRYAAGLDAARAAIRFLDLDSGEIDTQPLRASAENNAGYCLLALNRHEEAIPCFLRSLAAIRQTPSMSTVDVDVNLALTYLALSRLDEAEECVSRASALITSDVEPMRRYLLYLRGAIARKRGDRDAAMRHFSALRQYYPEIDDLEQLLLMVDVSPFLLPESE